MKRRDLLKHLEAHGCVFVREGHGHTICRQLGVTGIVRIQAPGDIGGAPRLGPQFTLSKGA